MSKLNWWKRACAVCLLGAAAAITLPAQKAATFTTLHSFDRTDGAGPVAALVQAANGNLYGTTGSGGTDLIYGTVFEITPSGTLTTLHSFNDTDGYAPEAALTAPPSRKFYGTTVLGGANSWGTVFSITGSGALTTLYSFCSQSNCSDGSYLYAGLVQGTDGNFYGATAEGGTSNYGTIFKMTSGGILTTLHSFDFSPDGAYPFAALIQAPDGDFYGTTSSGGVYGGGMIFKITRNGVLTTLYSFCSQSNCPDGLAPYSPLLQATDGNFYGITTEGGVNNHGTVFKISPGGTLTTLYKFCSLANCADGSEPYGGLAQATDGNFYGTTAQGGLGGVCQPIDSPGCGTVFEITPGGTLTTLHIFDSTDGANPVGALVQDTDGTFYGTNENGGANGYGTIFSLSVGLGPFVETLPTSGKVGATVKILGTNLTGATSVTFNGTAAAFTVVSPTLITTSVPTGATTGKVKVTTPSGVLTSNVIFRVR